MGGSFYAELLAAADSRAEDDEANGRAMKHLTDSFSSQPLAALTADEIELYLRMRLRQKVRRPTRVGFMELGLIKPATVHQEFSGASPHAQRRRAQEAAAGEPLLGCGVSGAREGDASAALHDVVGAADN